MYVYITTECAIEKIIITNKITDKTPITDDRNLIIIRNVIKNVKLKKSNRRSNYIANIFSKCLWLAPSFAENNPN